MTARDISVLETRLDAISEKLDRIEKEVRATNGRVRDIEHWRQRAVGALGVAAFAIPVVTALVVKAVVG